MIVKPDEIDDDAAVLLSHEIAREIEDQLEYPGQIKVTVIRESRAIDVAGNKLEARRAAASAPRRSPRAQPGDSSAAHVVEPEVRRVDALDRSRRASARRSARQPRQHRGQIALVLRPRSASP